MEKHTTIGIDLAKTSFAVVALSPTGKEQWRKTVRRKQLLPLLAKQAAGKVAMEACGSAHYWGRKLKELGHRVELLPPQHIKGYQRGQKNDYNDALAIAEASQHGRVRTVRIKTVEQQDERAFHTIRQGLTRDRLRLCNQMRGLLAENGIVLAQGYAALRKGLPAILEEGENGLTMRFRVLLERQYQRFVSLSEELAWYDEQLNIQVKADATCKVLMQAPGVGPVTASAFKSWIGDGRQFKRGREASAALGMVPRQHSTGGKPLLLGITKRGDKYLRALLVHGARSVVARVEGKTDPLSLWVQRIKASRGFNKAAVALANKMVRILWAMITRKQGYRPIAEPQAV